MNELITESIKRHVNRASIPLPQEHEVIVKEIVDGYRNYPLLVNRDATFEDSLEKVVTDLLTVIQISACNGAKVPAIRLVRRLSHAHLKACKEFVEYLMDTNETHQSEPEQGEPKSLGEILQRQGY